MRKVTQKKTYFFQIFQIFFFICLILFRFVRFDFVYAALARKRKQAFFSLALCSSLPVRALLLVACGEKSNKIFFKSFKSVQLFQILFV